MAFRRALAQRLFGVGRMTITNCRVSSPCAAAISKVLNQEAARKDPGGDYAVFRRYIHRQSLASSPELRFLPTGEKLAQKVRELDVGGGRIRLDGLRLGKEEEGKEKLTLKDAVKILELSQLEMVKSTLKKIDKDSISYAEFMEICTKTCASVDQGAKFTKMLDQSGIVIVLGNTVFLRPEKVMKAIEGAIICKPASEEEGRKQELEEMEKQKCEIDERAKEMVEKELWGGLGFLIVQTAVFMRLTFWDLSWDVMEPICFYVTSMYFMAGYGFFLRTSREPSFEGFYHSRFTAKQRKLFKAFKFDAERYYRLKKGGDKVN